MKKTKFDEPLAKAAADSLRDAAKAAHARAAQTTGFLVVWKNGRVAKIPVAKLKKRRTRLALLAVS